MRNMNASDKVNKFDKNKNDCKADKIHIYIYAFSRKMVII